MLSALVKWHQNLEADQIAVLNNPEKLSALPPGRQSWLKKIAELSVVERQQMLAHMSKYPGWRCYALLAKWMVFVNILAAVCWVLFPPAKGMAYLFMMFNLVGFAGIFNNLIAWFSYSSLVGRRGGAMRMVVKHASFALVLFVLVPAMKYGTLDLGTPHYFELMAFLLPFFLVCVVLPYAVALLRNREKDFLMTQLQVNAERDKLARELSESQLRLLRAQIEPHFLFNTLGAVQQLAEEGAPRAAELTANLIDFLRAGMIKMRTEEVTLRADFDLVDAYLRVMKVRLGDRLQFSVSLDDEVAQASVPSMIVLTLVENAIKHGIEPSLRGGMVSVAAEQSGGHIRIRVQDSGVGLAGDEKDGNGLDNIRRRLALIYGDAAKLIVGKGESGGATADVLLPIQARG